MPRQNLLTPISIVVAGLVLVVMLQMAPNARSEVALQDYPPAELTQTANALATLAASATAAYVGPATQPTNTVVPTQSGGGAIAPTSTPTRTPGPTSTPSPTRITATRQPTQVTSTVEIAPTGTPTNGLSCVPGQPVVINGEGPPRAGFLLYFNGRAVSGGSVESDGTFAIQLIVGNERPGDYAVEVRERGTLRLLRDATCNVPALAPTLTPAP